MKKNILAKITGGAMILMPILALAQTTDTSNFFVKVAGFTNQAIGLLLGIATLVFLVGVIQYVIAGGAEEKQKTAKSYMLYGIIGLVVMVAAWGIVNLLVGTLGLNTTTVPELPKFGTTPGS